MAFKMIAMAPTVRVGIDANSRVHIEVWPMENGWTRDIDPALSSGDPEEMTLVQEAAFAVGKLMFRDKNNLLDDIAELYIKQDKPDDEFEEGYTQALLDVRRMIEDAA